MTKAAFTERVRRVLAGGNISDDFPISVPDVEGWVDQAMEDVLATQLAAENNRDIFSGIHGAWLKEYCPTVECNEECGRPFYYFDLPIEIIDLPGEAGIYRVADKGGLDAFERTTPDYTERFQGLEAFSLSPKRFYWRVDTKIYLYPCDQECDITVTLVPKFSSLANTDQMNVPAGMSSSVMDKALEYGGVMVGQREDVYNDQNK